MDSLKDFLETNESWVAIDEECTNTLGQKCVGKIRINRLFNIASHHLLNFEILKLYYKETKFKGVYLRINLPRILKDGFI